MAEKPNNLLEQAFAALLSDDDAKVLGAIAYVQERGDARAIFPLLHALASFKKACELRDLETGERLAVNPRGLADDYRKVFGAFLEQYQKACAGMNIDYRLVRTNQPLETFVRAYLEERRRLSR